MGYSGRPMITVKNNRNLIKERKSLFDSTRKKALDHSQLPDLYMETEKQLSLYELDQLSKRRSNHLTSYKKERAVKNIISIVLVILVIATLTYIINNT